MKRCPSCHAVCLESHRHCPACGFDVRNIAPDDGDPYLGTTMAGKYHLVELIGVGAMGRVYRADHLNLDAQVAIKLLNPEIAADPQAAKRFHHEARAASRLRHPNTIQILDFGQAEHGALYIVMEMLRGRTLARIIEGPPMGTQRLVDLLGQALLALDEAHAAGVVHRDFKPENIFVEMLRTGREHIKVLDFGIAKVRGEAEAGLTSAGSVCGTPEYMSPEQIRGEELDARSDVYAAGVVMYEMLCRERPFESSGPVIDILTAHLHTAPLPPSKRFPELNVPAPLEAVCMRALSKSRDERFRSAEEFKQALEAAARGMATESCPQCGIPLPGTARFCSQCGAVLRMSGSFAVAAAPVAARGDTPKLPSLPLPLVGREAVLDRLEMLEREALVLVGEPGVGKTAVAEAWVKREEARFRRTASVGADPSGAQGPLYPLRNIVAQILDLGGPRRVPTSQLEVDRACREHPEDRPGLLELFGLTLVSTGLPLDARRRECVAAVLATLRRSGASLLFEDVHVYDGPSRRILGELVANPGESTVVCTAAVAEALEAEVEVLRLSPLDSTALDKLVQLGMPAAIFDLTGGVPFAIVEWLRGRVEGADSTVEGRLGLLPAQTRALLEAATVAGVDIQTAMVGQLAALTDPGRSIAELSLRGWLKHGPAHIGLEVTSPTLRRRVYEAMGQDRRVELHAQLAELLAGEGYDPIVVAFHADRGQVADAALLEQAGNMARDTFDDEGAVRWLRASIDAGRDALAAGRGDEGRQLRVALLLARVLRYAGDIGQSEAVLREALALAIRRQDRWAEVQARRSLSRIAKHANNHASARDELLSAVGAAMAGGDRATLAELYFDLAEVLAKGGEQYEAANELYEGILICTGGDGPDGDDGPDVLWQMVLLLGHLASQAGDPERARVLGRHALRHAERVQSPIGRARAHAFLGEVHRLLGQMTLAAESRRQAAGEMRQVGDRRSTAEMLISLADPQLISTGDARAWLREASNLSNQVGWAEGVQRSRAALAQLG